MKNIFAIAGFALLTAAAPLGARAQSAAPANGSLTLPDFSVPTPATTSAPENPPAGSGVSIGATPEIVVPEIADPGTAFADGIAAYNAGNFPKARGFFAAAEKNAVSASLEYDFGNACYQTSDFGAAILHYLRALALNPRDPDARQNLALARQVLNITIKEPGYFEKISSCFSLNGWILLLTLAGWAAIYLAVLPRLFRWRGAVPVLGCVLAGVIALVAGVGLWGAQEHVHDGVILHADTALKLTPTANSEPVGLVQAGEVGQTLEAHNGFYHVRLTNGELGWVDDTGFAPIWN
jgi:tetratricopeptide (TPR) repeat protein